MCGCGVMADYPVLKLSKTIAPFTVFSVSYYLEVHNAITIYYRSHCLPRKVELVVLDTKEHKHLHMVKFYILNRKLEHSVTLNSK